MEIPSDVYQYHDPQKSVNFTKKLLHSCTIQGGGEEGLGWSELSVREVEIMVSAEESDEAANLFLHSLPAL